MSQEKRQDLKQEAIRQPYQYTPEPFLPLPSEIVSRAICRVEAPDYGNALGTGFLIAPSLIITNYHVLEAVKGIDGIANQAAKLSFRFGYREFPPPVQSGVLFNARDVEALTASSETQKLDYALIHLVENPHDQNEIRIDPLHVGPSRAVVRDERVNILQHPGGNPGQLALGQVVYEGGDYFQHTANTEGGSSGSPVFDKQWNIIGLHRASGPDPTRKDTPEFGNESVTWMAIWPAIQAIVEQAWDKDTEDSGHESKRCSRTRGFPSIWTVPYPRNPFFVGRDQALEDLHTTFAASKEAISIKPLAISGLGGIGKTQIAVEFAYRYYKNYQAAFWVQADSREGMLVNFARIAALLDLPERHEPDQANLIQVVKQWFNTHTTWLLIFDNVEDMTTLREFLPSANQGHILLTTHVSNLGKLVQHIRVEAIGRGEGADLLLHRAKGVPFENALGKIAEDERIVALNLSDMMERFPLALDQAGAYIQDTGCSLSNYFSLYRKQCTELLNARGWDASDHPDAVITTFALAFKKVARANPASIELLRLFAFLQPDAIPEEIITGPQPNAILEKIITDSQPDATSKKVPTKVMSDLGPILQPVAADSGKLDKAFQELLKYSLVRRNTESNTVSLHRLVQLAIKGSMKEEAQRRWAVRAVRAVSRVFDDPKFTHWQRYHLYIPQAQVCGELILHWEMTFLEAGRLLEQAGYYLQIMSSYAQATPFYVQVSLLHTQRPQLDSHNMVMDLDRLAYLYYVQGKYTEAESLYKQALVIAEQVLGPDHPDTASSLHSLAWLYKAQGKYIEGVSLCERALTIREQVLGPDNSDTASSLHCLADLYCAQSKYAEAEPLYKRALDITEMLEPDEPDNPDTASNLHCLAWLYKTQGKYIEAVSLCERALTIREQMLGPNHPSTASSLHCLAGLYEVQGKYTEAEPLYKRALAIAEQVLGPDHPDTASNLHCLARLYNTQGKYIEAVSLCERALIIREQVLGPNHPDTATSLNSIVKFYQEQDKNTYIERLYKKVLEICENIVGSKPQVVLNILSDLAYFYYDQEWYTEAESLYKRAIEISKQIDGPDHLRRAFFLNNLAAIYDAQDKYAEAEPLYQEALSIRENLLGPDHPDVALVLENYAGLLQATKRKREATKLEKRAQVIRDNYPT